MSQSVSSSLGTFFINVFFRFRPLLVRFRLRVLLGFGVGVWFSTVMIRNVYPTGTSVLYPFYPLGATRLVLCYRGGYVIKGPPTIFYGGFLVVQVLTSITIFMDFTRGLVATFMSFFVICTIYSSSPTSLVAILLYGSTFLRRYLRTSGVQVSHGDKRKLMQEVSMANESRQGSLPMTLSHFLRPIRGVVNAL